MNPTPHIKTEGSSKFQIGDIKNNTIHYDFNKIITYLNIKGHILLGENFKIHKEDHELLYKLCCYFIQDHQACKKLGIDTNKGILLSGPVGCGKTSLMKLLPHIAPQRMKYEIISTRSVVFKFNMSGFSELEKFNDTKNYCFDDLGVEPIGGHYAKDYNVMGEILLSRYDLFVALKETKLNKPGVVMTNGGVTHATTNLNAKELENRYGSRVRSRLRELFNLISFDQNCMDKRK